MNEIKQDSGISAENGNPSKTDSITVRPILRSDSLLEEDFFEDLSYEHMRNRFLGGVSSLSDDEIDRLCEVDYHDSMAFIATTGNFRSETELGMARYALDQSGSAHEMAIVIADDVNAMEIGTLLLQALFDYARQNGVKHLYSLEFRNNMEIKALAEHMNMTCKPDPNDVHQLIYSIEF